MARSPESTIVTAHPSPPPADAGVASEPALASPPAASALVRGRWVDPQAVFVPGQGLIQYGDEIQVSPEQLADENTRAIAWDSAWVPDPIHKEIADTAAAAAAAALEGDA